MISFIRSILLFLIISVTQVWATDATLLPNGLQQFFDNNGNPLTSGKVYFYIPNTTTFKTTWQDAAKTTSNTNPVILDAAGRAIIYGDGTYRQILRKSNNDLVWDALTSSTGAGGGSGGSGDGTAVGTTLAFAGLIAPTNYVFAYGQEIVRSSFTAFYSAITYTQTVNCSSGSPILTGLADTTQISINTKVEVNCVAPGSFVISKTLTTLTLNNNASVSVSSSATFFPYGNGNGSTTFNVPDLRGVVIGGRDNMGGTAKGLLTSTYFAAPGTGATGGSQSKVLLTANLPAYTPSGTVSISDPGHIHAIGVQSSSSYAAGANAAIQNGGAINTASAITGITATFAGAAQGGTATAFSIVQPTTTLNYIIKVIADTGGGGGGGSGNINTIGGMTGPDIACGTGLSCSSNTINVTLAASQLTAITANRLLGSDGSGVIGAVTVPTGLALASSALNFDIPALTNKATPNPTDDYLILYDFAGNATKKASVNSIATAGTAGVTSLNGQVGALTLAITPGGRLSLTTGTPYPSSNVNGATHVYLTVLDNLGTQIYDGTNWVFREYAGELDLTLTAGNNLAATQYDVFVIFDTGAVRICHGPAWSNNGAGTGDRGTGAGTTEITSSVGGRLTNAVQITCKNNASSYTVPANRGNLVGGFRTILAGQVSDSSNFRFLWDLNRPITRSLVAQNTASTYAYTSTSARQCNAASAGGGIPVQVEWFTGSAGFPASLGVWSEASASGALVTVSTGIGINSSSANSAQILQDGGISSTYFQFGFYLRAEWTDASPLGYNVGYCLEAGNSNVSFYGNNGTATKSTGIIGSTYQ